MTFQDTNTILDFLMIDIVDRIQLTATDRGRANQAYHSIARHLDSEGSLLANLVEQVYGQGSMPIGATIIHGASDEDRFDVDAIVETSLPPNTPPETMHDLLFRSMNRGRYQGMVKRKSRCVTVEQSNLHIDLTPTTRLNIPLERPSRGFHFNHEKPLQKYHFDTNPKGMVTYFRSKLPQFYAQLPLFTVDLAKRYVEAAETEPLPEEIPLHDRPVRLMALQLLKRFRNLRFAKRNGRQPPSIYLSFMAATVQAASPSLLRDMIALAIGIRTDLENAERERRLIHHENPSWKQEIITDRWPASHADQIQFIDDLNELVGDLVTATTQRLPEQQKILARLFGEKPTEYALNKLLERTDNTLLKNEAATLLGPGGVALKSIAPAGALILPSAARAVHSAPNTNFGDDTDGWKERL